jgi:hypothetical protein
MVSPFQQPNHRIFRDVDAIGLRGHPGRLLVLRQLTYQGGWVKDLQKW